MKVALVGIGQAGGNVTERIVQFDAEMGFHSIRGALAINSAKPDLQSIDAVDTLLIGADRVSGHGVGGDNELGAEIMASDDIEVITALDNRIRSDVDAVFVVAGLGGGTGSGGAPVLVSSLQRIYDVPIYALGILPGRNESALAQANAGRSLVTLVREADSTLVVDNDAWHKQGESLEDAFGTINKNIAQRVGLLFAAGEATDGVGESVVDSSEVINTFRTGDISALGYASAISGDDDVAQTRAVTSVSRQALLSGTSLPEATTAKAALLIVAGRPATIPRKAVEKARRWLEDETGSMEVRGGDFPLDRDHVASLILLGGVERSDRIDDFMERTKRANRQEEQTEVNRDPAADLIDDRLENLF